jgi:branched-chain amino acid transport system ATP-binding protein
MLLECKNVIKTFGSISAVNNISFEIKAGEIFGIAGPNGSGKTTLFNLITGVYTYTGSVIFNGKKISGLKPHAVCHQGIARTFQIPHLFSTLSVYDNIRAGAQFGNNGRKNPLQIIEEVIEFVGLQGKENTVAANLKLLDKKLTMMAVALATNPKMLLLDEPMGGLSPKEIKLSIDMIKQVNEKKGITVIIIEHFMKVLTELSKRMMVLERGAEICLGPPREVTQNKKVIECYLGDNHVTG